MISAVTDASGERLSIDDVATLRRESPEHVREWWERGLLPGVDGELGPAHVERARLIRMLLEGGIDLDSIRGAQDEHGDLLGVFVSQLHPGGPQPTYTLEEAATRYGFDLDLARRLWTASTLLEHDDVMTDADAVMARTVQVALDAGLPVEALLELVHVYDEALGRVADAEARTFHTYVHERLRLAGLSGSELTEATARVSSAVQDLAEPTVLYFHRKGVERALREDLVRHFAEATGLLETSDVPGQVHVAIVFVDLSSFTPLTQAMGEIHAAEVLARFSALVRAVVRPRHGHIVKQIGDAFMLAFTDAEDALRFGLEIEERASAERHFPACRVGVSCGRVLHREGDYVGTTVNVAARLVAAAERHQILVSPEVHDAVDATPDVELRSLGRQRLKGLDELEVFAACYRGAQDQERIVDPVCGMVLHAGHAVVLLRRGDATVSFCSDACRERFVLDPGRYAGEPEPVIRRP
jgi:class 3 adenylate cyclase/YHS domain-containing protein